MKLGNYRGIFRKSQLGFVKSENPHDDYYVFDFSFPEKLNWEAGEHGIFSIPEKKIEGKKWRAFSVASIPNEGILKIATRIGDSPSSFKEALMGVKHGENIAVRGPFGWFLLQDEISPIVVVVGGIGVTPVRALLKELEKGNKRLVNVLYSARNRHLFRKDIEEISVNDDQIKVSFLSEREEVSEMLDELVDLRGKSAFYYLSGPRGMIQNYIGKLWKMHIPLRRIIFDPFLGY